MPAPPRVLYIMGTGRSGSTLLGIALGNVPGAFYAGELFAWNHFRGVPISEDEAVQQFWRRVADGLPPAAQCFEHDFYRELEHPTSLLRSLGQRRALARSHERHNVALLGRIGELTRATVVVDSSHFPLRAHLLLRNPELDVRIVHLVRDPRAVVNALQKDEQRAAPMPPLAANAYCWIVAALSAAVRLRVPREHRLTVRYEDMTDDPSRTIGRICDVAGLPRPGCAMDHLVVGPVFQGNRLRHRRSIAIERRADVCRLSPLWRFVTCVVQAPLLLAYGYLAPRRTERRLQHRPGDGAARFPTGGAIDPSPMSERPVDLKR